MEVGTLEELGVEVGDVVECVNGPLFGGEWTVGKRYTMTEKGLPCDRNGPQCSSVSTFRIISHANPKPKLWRDMTPEEKGALLLTHHENFGSVEFWDEDEWKELHFLGWCDDIAYRIKPQPNVETVTLYGRPDVQWVLERCKYDTHCITFQTIDGKPDCTSIKMEKI